jgi:hypothetical protein
VKSAIVFGSYGTFGRHITRELARLGIPLTIAGRDPIKAERWARQMGVPYHCGVNVAEPTSCRLALQGHAIAVNCAGPFSEANTALLQACLESECLYVDIGDDRAYAAIVRNHGELFHRRGLAAVYGCSSLPGISGALALVARGQTNAALSAVRVSLFIGNDNPKGPASIASLTHGLGKSISAGYGTVRGFRDREIISLPEPFGRRAVFNFDSPDYDLLPLTFGPVSVRVKVGFESSLVNWTLAALSSVHVTYRKGWNSLLAATAARMPRYGSSGGAVMSELFFADGKIRTGLALARSDGQRMASLPCVSVVHALASRQHVPAGAMPAYEFLTPAALLAALQAAGFAVSITERDWEGEEVRWSQLR